MIRNLLFTFSFLLSAETEIFISPIISSEIVFQDYSKIEESYNLQILSTPYADIITKMFPTRPTFGIEVEIFRIDNNYFSFSGLYNSNLASTYYEDYSGSDESYFKTRNLSLGVNHRYRFSLTEKWYINTRIGLYYNSNRIQTQRLIILPEGNIEDSENANENTIFIIPGLEIFYKLKVIDLGINLGHSIDINNKSENKLSLNAFRMGLLVKLNYELFK